MGRTCYLWLLNIEKCSKEKKTEKILIAIANTFFVSLHDVVVVVLLQSTHPIAMPQIMTPQIVSLSLWTPSSSVDCCDVRLWLQISTAPYASALKFLWSWYIRNKSRCLRSWQLQWQLQCCRTSTPIRMRYTSNHYFNCVVQVRHQLCHSIPTPSYHYLLLLFDCLESEVRKN